MKTGIVVLSALMGFGAWIPDSAAISADPLPERVDESRPAAAAAATADASEEFRTPPGFVKKKRGRFVLYCKRDTTIGTRIKTENCYDEQQVRDYLLALKETKDSVDRIRNTCGNICVCGSPEACNPNIREPR